MVNVFLERNLKRHVVNVTLTENKKVKVKLKKIENGTFWTVNLNEL